MHIICPDLHIIWPFFEHYSLHGLCNLAFFVAQGSHNQTAPAQDEIIEITQSGLKKWWLCKLTGSSFYKHANSFCSILFNSCSFRSLVLKWNSIRLHKHHFCIWFVIVQIGKCVNRFLSMCAGAVWLCGPWAK